MEDKKAKEEIKRKEGGNWENWNESEEKGWQNKNMKELVKSKERN